MYFRGCLSVLLEETLKLRQKSCFFDLQIVMDSDTTDQTLRRRAGSQIRGESDLCLFDFTLRHFQVVRDSDLCDFKDIVYILDIPFCVCPIMIFGRWNLLFGQEPGQCAHHSGSGRSYDVVEGGSMLFLRFNFIETLDPPVNTVINGLIKSLDHGSSCGTLLPHNLDP